MHRITFCSKNAAFLTSRWLHLWWSVSFQALSTPQDVSASRQTILGLLCVPYGTRQQMAFMPSLCRTKHNRAKPMSELASAMFSIADANEFRFARFYIVCEAVPLGTLESPLIVCGLSDTLRESPNVEETRNQMQPSGWKKYTHFSPTNVSYAVPPEICIMRFL